MSDINKLVLEAVGFVDTNNNSKETKPTTDQSTATLPQSYKRQPGQENPRAKKAAERAEARTREEDNSKQTSSYTDTTKSESIRRPDQDVGTSDNPRYPREKEKGKIRRAAGWVSKKAATSYPVRKLDWGNKTAGGKAKTIAKLAGVGTVLGATAGILSGLKSGKDPDELAADAKAALSAGKQGIGNANFNAEYPQPQVIKQGTGSLKTLGIAGVGAGAGYWAGKQARDQKEQSNKPKLPQLLGTMSHLRKK
jgi:hypothetical protein